MVVGDGQRARGSLDEVRRAGAERARCARTRSTSSPTWSPTTARCSSPRPRSRRRATTTRCVAEIQLSASMFAVDGRRACRRRCGHAEAAVRHAESAGQPFLLSQALEQHRVHPPQRRRGRPARAAPARRRARARGTGPRARRHAARDPRDAALRGRRPRRGAPAAHGRARAGPGARLSRPRELRAAAARRARGPRGALAARRGLRARRRSSSRSGRTCGTPRRPGTGPARSSTRTSAAWSRRASHAETGRRQAEELGDLAFATRCSHVLGFLALSLGDAEAAVRHLAPLRGRARRGWASASRRCSASAPTSPRRSCSPATSTRAREVQAELEARGRAARPRVGDRDGDCAAAG